MLQVNLDLANEEFRKMLREEIKAAVADIVRQNRLPPFLTKSEMKDVLRIGSTKASELMNRPDFPVCREAGVLIPTHLLFKWVDRNTRWLEENSKYFDNAV